MIRKKIENYLLKQEGVSFHKQSDSGSTYYKIGSSKIRVADHMSSTFNNPKTLEIVIPVNSESIVLVIGSKLAIMKNYGICDIVLVINPENKIRLANVLSVFQGRQINDSNVTEHLWNVLNETINLEEK